MAEERPSAVVVSCPSRHRHETTGAVENAAVESTGEEIIQDDMKHGDHSGMACSASVNVDPGVSEY